MRFRYVFGWLCLAGALLVAGAVPLAAQQNPPGFATNTPPPPPLAFATNTPQPLLNPVIAEPEAPQERYALRRWDEAALVNVLLDQVRRLQAGEVERSRMIRLLQLELAERFPNAPRRPEQREALLQAMLAAPRGMVDMRGVVRPYVAGLLSAQGASFDVFSSLTAAGFSLTITPFKLAGTGMHDALVHIRYPADTTTANAALYDDYIPLRQAGETFTILDGAADIPAAPFNMITQISLERLGDMDGNGLEEFALAVTSAGSVNQEYRVFGWRGEAVASLVLPGQTMQAGQLVDWPREGGTLTVTEYQMESPEWGCLGERDVTWTWAYNFFRPASEPGEFHLQNTTGCRLYQAEPLFTMPVDDAISTIEGLIQTATGDDRTATDRAAMTVALLRVLEGRADLALGQVERLATTAEPGSWLVGQIAAFQEVAARSNTTPLTICAALQHATRYGVCDVDAVLTRQFSEDPLRRDIPLRDQLEMRGFIVGDMVTLSAVGQFDRQLVNLVFDDSGYWWSFAPLSRETYTAEPADPPVSAIPAAERPTRLAPPPGAWPVLLDANMPGAVLGQLDNLMQEYPGVPLDSAARFIQAFSYDLIGARDDARQGYFTLWSDDPASIWGQLAAAHLELR
jgi:hypothetical protein